MLKAQLTGHCCIDQAKYKVLADINLVIKVCRHQAWFYSLQLRLQGNAEARGGDLPAAERAYSKGIELELSKGKHTLHANRSGVRLTLGNAEGALEDAQAAVKLGPASFTTAYIRQVSYA